MSKEAQTPQPIIVPTDFTEHSSAALNFAVELSLAIDPTHPIILLHVVHDPEGEPGTYRGESAAGLRTMDDVGEEMMKDFIAYAAEKYPQIAENKDKIKLMHVPGVPSLRITEVANKLDAFMIVMGSHGRKGIKALLLGSKSTNVLQHATMPVTIVKAKKVKKLIEQTHSEKKKKKRDAQ